MTAPATRRAAARAGVLASALAAALTAGLIACAAPPTAPSTGVGPVAWREPLVDIEHYDVDVAVDHEAGHVEGEVAVRFRALPDRPATEVVLDAVDLVITGAWDDDGRALLHEQRGHVLRLPLLEPVPAGETGAVHVAWSAYPRTGLHFVAPGAHAPGRPWHVWTQGQAEDTRHWMPVWDLNNDTASHSLTLTVDADLMTMAAGELVDSRLDERTGTRTETWEMTTPHVSYLITFVAGGFARAELGGARVPLPVLADKALLPLALENSRHTAAMLPVLEELTGTPYPYPKYAQTFVHDYTAGGMENVSATTLYSEGIHEPADEPRLDITDLLAHELAHQWFGDLVSGRGWAELWLNEGFATYCEAVVAEALHGPARAALVRRGWQRDTVTATDDAPRPLLWPGFAHPDEAFDAHAYSGGAARVHLLRDQLGDEAFLAALRLYLETHAGGVATTADLQAAFEATSGRDLDVFFDEWVRSSGYPSLRAYVLDGERLQLSQVQGRDGGRPVYHVSVAVSWARGGVEHRGRVGFQQAQASLALEGAGELEWVHVDSAVSLPGTVLLDQPEDAWRRQLRDARDPVTRLIAAEWFGLDGWVREVADDPRDQLPGPASREALARAAREDPFTDVRVAALRALGLAPDEATAMLALDLAEDPAPELRAAALEVLAVVPGDDARTVLRHAVDDESSDVALTALTALVDRGEAGAWESLQRLYERVTDRKLRLRRDLVLLADRAGGEQALPFVVRALRTDPSRWVRGGAVDALAGWEGPHAETVFRLLAEALHDESYHVRLSAARALGSRGDPRAVPQLRARRSLEGNFFTRQALDAALAELGAGAP